MRLWSFTGAAHEYLKSYNSRINHQIHGIKKCIALILSGYMFTRISEFIHLGSKIRFRSHGVNGFKALWWDTTKSCSSENCVYHSLLLTISQSKSIFSVIRYLSSCREITYFPKIHLKCSSFEISSVDNIHSSCPIVLKLWNERDSDNIVFIATIPWFKVNLKIMRRLPNIYKLMVHNWFGLNNYFVDSIIPRYNINKANLRDLKAATGL